MPARLVGRRAGDRHQTRVDHALRRLSARGQPASHQLGVEPATSGGHPLVAGAFLLAFAVLLAGAFFAPDFFAADFFVAVFFVAAFLLAFFVVDDSPAWT